MSHRLSTRVKFVLYTFPLSEQTYTSPLTVYGCSTVYPSCPALAQACGGVLHLRSCDPLCVCGKKTQNTSTVRCGAWHPARESLLSLFLSFFPCMHHWLASAQSPRERRAVIVRVCATSSSSVFRTESAARARGVR